MAFDRYLYLNILYSIYMTNLDEYRIPTMQKYNTNFLTLEQQFNLRKVADQTKALSQQQAQELIVELQRQIMIKDNLYKEIMRHE